MSIFKHSTCLSRYFDYFPNIKVWTDCLEPDLHKLCLFTLRPISKDEELTFDYQQGSTNEPTTPNEEEAAADSADTDLKQEGFTCKCGASNCRKTIFL